jgi:hypothetical protein
MDESRLVLGCVRRVSTCLARRRVSPHELIVNTASNRGKADLGRNRAARG